MGAGCRCRLDDEDGAALRLRLVDEALAKSEAALPAVGCGPTVIDDDHDRTRSLQAPALGGVQDRLGEREDHECGGEQADEQQPPGRACRCLLVVLEADQDAASPGTRPASGAAELSSAANR